MSEGLKQSGKEVKGMMDVSFKAYQASIALSNDEVTKARVELELKSMKDEMKNDWSNASIVINKYSFFCKDLLEKPEERVEYWLNKKD